MRVVVTSPRLVRVAPTISLVGSVMPNRRSVVSAEIAGLVTEVPLREGDAVAGGQIVCRINEESLSFTLEEARARVSAAEARLAELRAGTRAEELRRLQALLDEANADTLRWKFEWERIDRLYTGQDSNAKEINDTRAALAAAQARRDAAQARLDEAVAGPRIEEIAEAAHVSAERSAAVKRLESDLRRSQVRAPFDGLVVKRWTEVGQWLAAGGATVEIVELAVVLVRVHAPEAALDSIEVGQVVRVRVDALGRTFSGSVRHVIRDADSAARTFPIEIEVDNRDGQLAPGMFVRALVSAGAAAESLAVPRDAVLERGGTDWLALVTWGDDGSTVARTVPITVGIDVEDWVAVNAEGLTTESLVVTRGTELLRPFPIPVQIVDPLGNPRDVHDLKPKGTEAKAPDPGTKNEATGTKSGEREPTEPVVPSGVTTAQGTS